MSSSAKGTEPLVLSPLGKTWLIDLDGTVFKHNGYIIDGKDTFLPGAKEFLLSIPDEDRIVFLTSRTREVADQTAALLSDSGIRFEAIIPNLPTGERILINDVKPSGLETAFALNVNRDAQLTIRYTIDSEK